MSRIFPMVAYFILNVALARDLMMAALVLPTFFLILYFSIRSADEYISLDDMIWLCIYLFFVIVPIQSFDSGFFDYGRPATGIYFSYSDVGMACAIVFVFTFVFGLILSSRPRTASADTRPDMQINQATFLILAVIASGAFLAHVAASGGFGRILGGGRARGDDVISGLPLVTLAVQVVVTQVLFATWIRTRLLGIAGLVTVSALLLLLAIAQNPFNTARFFLISSWVPIFLIYFRGNIRAILFYLVVFFGIIFVMPILSITTRAAEYDISSIAFSDLLVNALQLPFMDAFDTLCALIQYIDRSGYNYGQKFISLVLFLVPRAVWAGKATLTGLDVGDYLFYAKIAGTSNLSMFVGGDFYADFGLPGVAAGAAATALFVRWFFIKRAFLVAGQELKTYIFLAFLPILIRGPLGATVALIFLELTVLGALSWLTTRGGLAAPAETAPRPLPGMQTRQVLRRSAWMLPFALVFALAAPGRSLAQPVIFWVSDPIAPGETALVAGTDFGAVPAVKIRRLADTPVGTSPEGGEPVLPVGTSEGALKLRIPPALQRGVYELSVSVPAGAVTVLLNAPTVYWVQGNLGDAASPGGWIRVMGRNIVRSDAAFLSVVEAAHGREVARLKTGRGDLWDARFDLPAALPPGQYRLALWNGQGDASTIRTAEIGIRAPEPWPSKTVDLRSFGAAGDGVADDDPAVARALTALREAGGGTLLVPRGLYMLSGGIVLPPRTRLRGEDRDLSVLIVKNQESPPKAFISGQTDFAVESLTILAANHWHLIEGGFGEGEPRGRNITVDQVTVRASFYRQHLKPERVQERYLKSISVPGNGPDAIRLRGDNLTVTNSDIYSSVRSIFIPDSRYITISNNRIHNGRRGWYSISRSSALLFEGNTVEGADLQASGGGINTLFGEGRMISSDVLFRDNSFANFNGMDGEAMTADGPGGCYWGGVQFHKGQDVAEAVPAPGTSEAGLKDCVAGGFLVVGGRGAGEFALVRAVEGRFIRLDRPMPLESGSDTVAVLIPVHMRYLAIGNRGADVGTLLQVYGGSVDQVFADNGSIRTGGYSVSAVEYLGYPQASFYAQLLNNTAKGGSISSISRFVGATSFLQIFSDAPPKYEFPLVRGVVVRGNRLEGNASIKVAARAPRIVFPSIVDVIIEGNSVSNSKIGIDVGPGTAGTLLIDNHFENVALPILDQSRKSGSGGTP